MHQLKEAGLVRRCVSWCRACWCSSVNSGSENRSRSNRLARGKLASRTDTSADKISPESLSARSTRSAIARADFSKSLSLKLHALASKAHWSVRRAAHRRCAAAAQGMGATLTWRLVISLVILKLIDLTIGLRVTTEKEREGLLRDRSGTQRVGPAGERLLPACDYIQ